MTTTRTLTLVASLAAACSSDGGGSGDSTTDATGTTTTAGSDSTSAADSSTTGDGSTTAAGSTTSADATGTGSTGDTGEPIELAGACALDVRVGGFLLAREADYTTFSGAVADGVVPSSVLENVGEQGDCRLLRRNNPFCDPMCGPTETCDFDGSCLPYPLNHDVGVVDVDGLLQPVSVEPIAPTFNYFDTSLPNPAWDDVATLELSAAGGDYEPFTMHGFGVAMIVPSGPDIVLDPAADLELTWEPEDESTRVRIELAIDQHGITPSKLVCDAPDTGSLVVASSLLTDFVGLGVTGFPAANFFRETVDSVTLAPGCVEFAVRSHASAPLTVVGHTPCTSDDDCPDGQTCDIPNETCM